MSAVEPVRACRSCLGPVPLPFLTLGELAVANRLPVDPSAVEERFLLSVGFCPACSLVQLTHALPPEAVFDADYPYFSSYSEGLVRHAAEHVATLIADRGLDRESLVVEVASNDGYLLQHVVAAGVRAIGVEPTPGPAAASRARNVPTVQAFFGRALAAELVAEHGRADVVVANNVMAHVPDLNDFVRGLADLVTDDGVITVENPGVGSLLAQCAFDTIYHEHYCYFSTLTVESLARRNGLTLVHVEEFPQLHGGTLRWHLARSGCRSPAATTRLEAERAQGLDQFSSYERFGDRVTSLQRQLRSELLRRKLSGQSIAAYGAAAKGATLLGSTGIDATTIDFVVDRNEHKHGRYLPGTGIPVLPVEALVQRRPDVVLLLAWNVADEVVRQQQPYLDAGGTFLLPVPEVRTLGTGPACR